MITMALDSVRHVPASFACTGSASHTLIMVENVCVCVVCSGVGDHRSQIELGHRTIEQRGLKIVLRGSDILPLY